MISVEYDAENDWVVLVGHGQLGLQELAQTVTDAAALAQAHVCLRGLADFREATFTISLLEMYGFRLMTRDAFAKLGPSGDTFRRALVVKKLTVYMGAFESMSQARGQNVKVFEDIELAKQWLQAV